MTKLKQFVKFELTGWTKFEISWLIISVCLITGLSIYWGDNLMGIISSVSGVICVLCTGKGKLSAYIFGLVNCVLYAIIAYKAKLYGETMLNLIYYVPMQFVGFRTWSKHINTETAEVEKRKMNTKQRIILVLLIAVATVIYGFLLKYLNDSMPFIDSFTTMASVFALIVSIKMYVEQWYIWFFVDGMTVVMWAIAYANGNDSVATLIMWALYLVNAVIMCIKWEKECRKND